MKNILPAFLSCQGTSLTDDEKRLFAAHNPLGVCLFAKGCANVQNRRQLSALVKQIKEVIGRDDVLIAIDQEGGRVRRLTEPEFTPVAAQADITTPELATIHANLISADLQTCGINVNFAPVLDIQYPETSSALTSRCFLGNKEQVAALGRAMTDAYMQNGICPCIKHLPGHGRGQADPHLQLPVITASLDELAADFYPFQQLNDVPMGMAAHIVLTAVDATAPVTCSAKAIKEIIRDKIGFTGLLVSDAVMMNALHGDISERAQNCWRAGCDVICLGNADFAANEALCAGKIALTDAAAERLARVRQVVQTAGATQNLAQLKNKYCAALKNIITYDYNYDATEVLTRLRQS